MPKTIKLHSFCVRVMTTASKELFMLCRDVEEAEQVYTKLSPEGAPPFNPSKGGWVYVDLNPAPAPQPHND